MNAKETRAGQLDTDILATLTRKQHLDNVQVLLNLFLTAMGKPLPAYATVKSPTALSRFLNQAPWSLTAMIRVMRHPAQSPLKAYRKRCVGRPPRLELMVDLTSIAKEGRFEGLGDWMHTLNSVQGVHVVLLYLCCGELRLPWSFLIWRGKGQPSPTQLAVKLLHGLPAEVRHSSKTIHLLADGGFSSKAFIQGVIRLKFAGFIGRRADRKTSTGQHLRDITIPGRKIKLHDLPGVPLWVTWVWLPAKKGDAQERRFIVSTVPRTAQVIQRTGKGRWMTWALFKTLKRRFGVGKFGQQTKRGVLRFLCLSFLSFLLCHVEFLDRPDPGDPAWPDWGKLARDVRQKFLAESSVSDRKPYRHRFPLSIIQHALWLYHRFPLSERDVQELLHQRGIQISHETLRQWNIKFAPLLTEELRHREPRWGSRWFLDEVCIEIGGKKHWLWRAVDDSGAVLDLLLQDRWDTQTAKTFFERLLVHYDVPDVIHTDKLWSYGATLRELPVLHNVEHVQVISTARCNNLIEQSHRPTRQQERSQIGFKNPRRAQEFLALHACVSNLHQHTRKTISAHLRRSNQNRAHLAWRTAVRGAV